MTLMSIFTPKQTEFIQSVLSLQPRIATFDCDGTLWSGDAGEGFFSWELEHNIVSKEIAAWARARYADYKAGSVAEEVMCGEMVTMHRGLQEKVVQQACDA
jgi:phosphoserine phosphatase